MSLLKRLASAGLGLKGEPQEPAKQEPAPAPRVQRPNREPVSEYARRAPQGLDAHGRPLPVNNSPDDDQLEIPAFLRRQAN